MIRLADASRVPSPQVSLPARVELQALRDHVELSRARAERFDEVSARRTTGIIQGTASLLTAASTYTAVTLGAGGELSMLITMGALLSIGTLAGMATDHVMQGVKEPSTLMLALGGNLLIGLFGTALVNAQPLIGVPVVMGACALLGWGMSKGVTSQRRSLEQVERAGQLLDRFEALQQAQARLQNDP